MVYDDLTQDPTGPCGDMFEVDTATDGPTICTHGPDPAPSGIDVRTRQPVLRSAPAAQTAPIPCIEDGKSGPRVHAIYAVAADVPDRYAQVVGSIRTWAQAVEGVVEESALKTGGARGIRWLTQASAGGCELVVDHVVMSAAGDDSFANTVSELRTRGYARPDRRYLAWVDASLLCGIGNVAIDDQPGTENANNGVIALYSRVDTGCWGLLDQFASGPNFLSVEAHEVMHNFGAVQDSAPHSTGGGTGAAGGHCFDEWDAMCYDDDNDPASFPLEQICADNANGPLLDCNNDDYFHTDPAPGSYLDTNWNSANAIFFTGTPFPISHALIVEPTGAGGGVITGEVADVSAAVEDCAASGGDCSWADNANDIGIDCGAECSASVSANMLVLVVATPNPGSSFGGFTGDCEGTQLRDNAQGPDSGVCFVPMDRARTVAARFASPAPQPDVSISSSNGQRIGNDIYNSTGAQQSKSANIKRGRSATFQLRLENDSSQTDGFKVKGTGGNKKFAVTYTSGGDSLTSFIVNGTLSIPDVPPNAFVLVTVKIKAKSAAAVGDKQAVKFTATSLDDGSKVDVVKVTAKVV